MTKYLFLTGLLLILFCTTACEDFEGGVEGIVTSEETGEPIQNAKILIVSLKDSTLIETRTNANGYYTLSGARYGVNELRVWKDGYENDKKIADVLRGKTETVDFQLEPLLIKTSMVIKIQIEDENGNPVTGATVDLYQEVEPGFVYAGTEVTEDTSAQVTFRPGLVDKYETIVFETRVAARGFLNSTERFTLEWNHAYPNWVVKLQRY